MTTTIMIVEDDAIIAEHLGASLGRLGYQVAGPYATGEEAVAAASALRPEMVLMDIGLAGEMDGIAAADLIRARCRLPVVFLTAHADPATLARAKVSEPFGYLAKPFQESSLQATIEVALYRHQLEERLRESEARYHLVVDHADDWVYWADEAGRCRYCSPSSAWVAGRPPESFLADPALLMDIVHPEDRAVLEAHQRAVHAAGVEGQLEFRVVLPDGAVLWLEHVCRPVYEADGRWRGWRASHRDITERRRVESSLRASEAQLRKAQHFAHMGSWTWNIQTNQLSWSDEMYSIFGLDRQTFSGDLAEVIARAIHPADRAAVDQANLMVSREGRSTPLEYRVVWGDGTVRVVWAEAGELVRDAAGAPYLLSGTVQDITERQQAEEALRKSEARYRAVVQSAKDAIISADSTGRIVSWNPGAERIFGYTESEAQGQPLTLLVPAPYQAAHLAGLARIAAGGEQRILGKTVEVAGRRKDGREIPLELSLAEWQVATDRFYTAIIRDITDRRRADEGLRRYQLLANHVSEGMLFVRPGDGRILDANAAALALYGYTLAELRALTVYDLRAPQTRSAAAEQLAQAARTGVLFEAVHRRKDGGLFPVEVSSHGAAIDGEPTLLSLVRDITERKRAEATLRESEARFSQIFEASPVPITLSRQADGVYLDANEAFLRFSGFTRAEVIGHTALELAIYPDPDMRLAVFQRFQEQGRLAGHDQPFRTKTGVVKDSLLWLETISVNQETCLLALALDITERKRAEAALKASEAQYQALFSAMQEGFALHAILCDEAGRPVDYRFLDVNPAFEALTGLTRAQVLGRTVREVMPGTETYWIEAYGRVALTGASVRLVNYARDLGRHFEVVAFSPAQGKFATIFTDITTRKQQERQQAAMIAVSTALRAAVTRAEMLPIILDQALALVDVEDIALVSVEPQTGVTWVELARGVWQASVGQRLPAGEGASGRVITSGQTFVSNDVRHEVPPRRLALAEGVVATAIVPLIAQHHTIGALAVGSRHPIDPVQVRLLEAIGDIAANALQRATLHEQTRRRADEFAALYATARELAAQQDLAWLLETIVTRALALIPATGALVALYDQTNNDLEIAVVQGLPIPVNTRLRLGEGAVGRVAQTCQPLIVENYQTWEGRSARFDHLSLQGLLSVPLLSGGFLIGVLQLEDVGLSDHRFSEADANLLTLLASHAASAVHNARVLEDVKLRADQLALVYDAGLALNSQLELRALLEYLAKIIVQALHADVLAFFRFDAATQTLSFELNMGEAAIARTRLDGVIPKLVSEGSFAAEVARTRQPLCVPDLHADPRYVMVDLDFRSGLWVPVQHQGQLRGVLAVLSRRPAAFTDRDERLLLLFANQTAVAIQNAHLFAETDRRLRQVQALRQVDVAIASNLELRPTLNVLLDQTLGQLQVDAAAFLLLDPRQQVLEHAASRGFRTRAIERSRIVLGDGPTGRAVQARQLVTIPNLACAPERLRRAEALTGEGFAAYYAAPLIFRGQIRGVLEIFQRAPLNPDGEWLEYLETLAGQAALAVENVGLFDELQRSNAELTQAYDATIAGWSRALDLRDKETEGHSLRVTDMTLALAQALGVDAEDLVHIRRGALLHDIGKMGVPDAILFKPGPLTEEEWAVMRRHPELAYAMLSPIAFLRPALDIPYAHHEKWDGTGYPRGLKGEQIPLAARIFTMADVWDALCSDRPYRPAWPEARVRDYFQAQAGRAFDPHIVETFLKLHPAAAGPAPAVILLVDPDPGARQALADSLQADYAVYLADSAEAAWRILENVEVAVVVTEQRLPDQTGAELLARVRPLQPACVGLLCTDKVDSAVLIQALNLGNVKGFLAKPWEAAELRRRVAEAVQHSQALAGAAPAWPQAQPAQRRTLLVVDDDPNILHSLARSLRDLFTVITATSGEEACAALEREAVDIILIDQRMPSLTGVEVLEQARHLRPAAVAILFSGYSDVDALAQALNLGNVYGFITKPWDWEDLRRQLTEAAQHRPNPTAPLPA